MAGIFNRIFKSATPTEQPDPEQVSEINWDDITKNSLPSFQKHLPEHVIPGHIQKITIRLGKGANCIAYHGDIVTVHYDLYKFKNGFPESRPFDSTTTPRKKPHKFELMNQEVIPVLDIAVNNMKLGERAIFLSSPKYAYGAHGIPELKIEPAAYILLLVELVSATKPTVGELAFRGKISVHERDTLGEEDLYDIGEEFKKQGNKAYGKTKYMSAVENYKYGLEWLMGSVIDDDTSVGFQRLIFAYYINLVVAFIKLDLYDTALQYCQLGARIPEKFLTIKDHPAKLHYRLALIYLEKRHYEKAKVACKKALQLEPRNREIHELLAKIDFDRVD